MENFIKPRRLTFADEMGVASKSSAKPIDMPTIKPQHVKLMEIKFDSRDVAAIKSPVENVSNKTTPTKDKENVTNEQIVKELGPD